MAAALHAARPRVSLWWLVAASIAPDLVDVALAVVGVCNPFGLYSHTVPAAVLLGSVLAGAAVLAGSRETAVLVLLAVLLHLPLDFVTGRKLYWPGGELHGLQLYDRPLADFVVEVALLAAGWALLRRRVGAPRWAASLWSLVALAGLQGAVDGLTTGALKPNACSAIAPESPRP